MLWMPWFMDAPPPSNLKVPRQLTGPPPEKYSDFRSQ